MPFVYLKKEMYLMEKAFSYISYKNQKGLVFVIFENNSFWKMVDGETERISNKDAFKIFLKMIDGRIKVVGKGSYLLPVTA